MKTKTQKKNKSVANPRRIRDESATNPQRIRYAFAPILQQFRAHTRKNEARLWIPIETSLLIRYEFAALSPQTRYAFVAILLYCGANGTDEVPLDAKFMSNVLVIDVRTLQKSFDELLFANLLQERIEREDKKAQTDRQDALDAGVSVNDLNLSKTETENKSKSGNPNPFIKVADVEVVNENANANEYAPGNKIINSTNANKELTAIAPGIKELNSTNGKHSQFTIEECLRYVEVCQANGEKVQSPKALARNLFSTGTADAFIRAALFPEQQTEIDKAIFGEPRIFTDNPCAVCFGAKMADADGKGFRACDHCRNERGKSTGLEPETKGGNDEQPN